MITKQEARRTVKEYRKSLSISEVLTMSKTIAGKVALLEEFQRAEYVFLYKGINNEVITDDIAKAARDAGKITLYPKVRDDDLDFYKVESDSELVTGFRDILEPSETCKLMDSDTGIVIMPGLAFDYSFNRVGYGRGFYDRFLMTHPKLTKVGIAFSPQVFEELEHDERDIPLDMIVTDTTTYSRKG